MNKKILLSILAVIFLAGGVITGVILVRQQQLIQKDASVPDGIATVKLSPETKTGLQVGDTFDAQILFNTSNVPISAIAVQLDYTYDAGSSQPPIIVDKVTPNSQLISESSWRFPIKEPFTYQDGNARIRIAGIDITPSGFSAASDTLLATVTFRVAAPGSINVTFDPQESKITKKATAEDTLLTPSSTGAYTAAGDVVPTSAPTPTSAPNATPTVAPTNAPGVTPTSAPAATPTSAPAATPTSAPNNNNNTSNPVDVNITSPQNNQSITDTTPTIAGTAAANASVTVAVDSGNGGTGTVSAGADGRWSWTVPSDLQAGAHSATATALDANNRSSSDTVSFTITTATGATELPVAGNMTPTLIIVGLGLFLLLIGTTAYLL